MSAHSKAVSAHREAATKLKAKRRISFYNAYVNVKLGHRVPYTVSGNIVIHESGRSMTLKKDEVDTATKKVIDVQAKRAEKVKS